MNEQDIKELIDRDFRIHHLLGYATALIIEYAKIATTKEKHQCYWFIEAINDVVYLDKPLPPMPED